MTVSASDKGANGVRHVVRFGDAEMDVADRAIDTRPLGEDFLALLTGFLRDTEASCSFYEERFARAGFSPDLPSLAAFRALPTLGPAEVAAIPETRFLPDVYARKDGLFTLPPERRLAKKFLTTSSTGRPKASWYTVGDWQSHLAQIDRQMGHLPAGSFSRTFSCFNGGHFGGKYTEDAFNAYGCIVENRHPSHATDEAVLGQLTNGLRELGGFNCLSIPPWRTAAANAQKGTTLDGLLNADVDNYIGTHIRVINAGGASIDEPGFNLRERLREANDLAGTPPTMVCQKYGASEVGTGAADCLEGNGLHLYQGVIYTEIIDEKTGEHVKSGERGLIVCTGLRQGSRYIRYAVGDEALFIDEPCACGVTAPRIRDIRRVLDRERLNTGCAAGGV